MATGSAADGGASFLERALAEATGLGDEMRVSLNPADLDPLLEPVFGEAFTGYQPLADALAKLA